MPDLLSINKNAMDPSLELNNYKELPNNKALALLDLELKVVYCNDTFSKLFSLAPDDSLYRLNPNSDFLFLMRGFKEKKFRNLSSDVVLSLPGKYEASLYEVSLERIFVSPSQFFIVTIESLEQRKTIERKISALHNALDHGNVPVMITDTNKKIVYATRSFEDLFSTGMDSLYNQSITELLRRHLSFDEHDQLVLSIEKLIPWKKLISINKKGHTEYWELYLQPFVLDEQMEPSLILSASNLTEHIYQKKIIEGSEKKQKLIIENISDLLLILKTSDNSIYFENANDNFCKIFNLDKAKLHSTSIFELLPANLSTIISQSIYELINNKSFITDFSYKHSESLQYYCKITWTSESRLNSSIFIITMKDVTDEVLYREQLEKAYMKEMQLNKMKSDFLANISHEIRTPFNGIIGYSEIIDECMEANDFASLRELVDSLKEVLGRSLNLFNNLVEVSQLESGEVEIEKVDLNCNQVLRHVYEKRNKEAVEKNLDFKMALSEEECYVEIDWIKLERIIDVLIDNAIKYTQKGSIFLGSETLGDNVIITISDTGIGIEKNQIARTLRPFSQEVEGYTRPYEGVGLGLTIAYKLTELLGGNFEIISEKNIGTEIRISFTKSNFENKNIFRI